MGEDTGEKHNLAFQNPGDIRGLPELVNKLRFTANAPVKEELNPEYSVK